MMNRVVRAVFAAAVVAGCGSVWADIPASAYVQDGLIAQWDGIENAGAGQHDPNAATWKNLKPVGLDFSLPSGCTVGDDSVTIPAKTKVTTSTSVFPSETPDAHAGTYECYWATPAIPTSGSYAATVMFVSDMSFFYRVDKDKFQGTARMADGKFYRHNFSYTATEQRSFHTVSYATMGTTTADNAFYLDGASRSGTVSGNGDMAQTARTGLVHHDTAAYPVIYKAARIYNRKLTEAEVVRNAAVDRLRFSAVPPDGYRWNATTQKPEIQLSVVTSSGTVSLNGGAASQRVEGWFEAGSTLTITLTPAAGASLKRWDGGTVTEGGEAGTYTCVVAAPVTLMAVCGKNEKTWNGVEGDLWSDGSKWSPTGVPEEGDLAVIPAGKNVTVDDSTAKLAFLDVSGTVVCSGWTTCVEADDVVVRNGGKVTCLGPVTTETEMSRIYLKAGDITIEQGGSVDVSGLGWKGGDAANNCGYGPGTVPNVNAMAAGSHGGIGSLTAQGETTRQAVRTNVYGNASAPETAGSGGCGGRDKKGGAGGGVIRLDASGRVTVNGSVIADGKPGTGANWGAGAGGSVYITCRTFAGAHGKLTAAGASGTTYGSSWTSHSAGGGRLAIIFNKQDQAKEPVPVDMKYSADCGPYHRVGEVSFQQAQPGTLYFSSDTLIDRRGATLFGRIDFADVATKWTVDSFRLTNGWASLARDGVEMEVTGDFEVTGKSLVCRRMVVDNSADKATTPCTPDTNGTRWDVGGNTILACTNLYPYYYASAVVPKLTVGGDLVVSSNGIVQVFAGPDPLYPPTQQDPALTNLGAVVTVVGAINLFATGKVFCASHPYSGVSPCLHAATLSVDSGSMMSADDRGYFGGSSSSSIVNQFSMSPSWPTARCGASHGGLGGWCADSSTAMGPVFESEEWPLLPGPGGHATTVNSAYYYGPRGGGVLRVFVTGDAVMDGLFSANATLSASYAGSGAGGSVLLSCRTLSGGGTFMAAGADGYEYTSGSNKNWNGGGGAGGRIAVHYDPALQGTGCRAIFKTPGGAGVGTSTGDGNPGTTWMPDDKVIAGSTTYTHKGKIFCPNLLSQLTLSSLILDDALLDLGPGGGLDVAGDIVIRGTSKVTSGINIPCGYLRCGGNLVATNATVSVTGGEPARASRFSVEGDVSLSGVALKVSHAETDGDAVMSIGGGLTLTNASTVAVQPGCQDVEGVPGVTFLAQSLALFADCWICPYSHNTNGASVLFRIPRIDLAADGGFDATGKGYGRTTSRGDLYGPTTTATDGRGTDGDNALWSVGAGHGGAGGLAVPVGGTFNKVTYAHGRGLAYDSFKRPVLPGCGGASRYSDNAAYTPHRGGGVVRIETDVMHMHGGSLLASAPSSAVTFRTGASGGSVFVRAQRFYGENGIIRADGGNGGTYAGTDNTHRSYTMAAGAGGRVAVHYANESELATNVTVSVKAGVCTVNAELYPEDAAARKAEDGTVCWKPIGGLSVLVR